MKTAAIIAEYNPFHNGHKYQIEETKRQTGANFIVVVMSGILYSGGFRQCTAKPSVPALPFSQGLIS